MKTEKEIFELLSQDMPAECERVYKETVKLSGLYEAIAKYKELIGGRVPNGDGLIFAIARINLLRSYRNEPKII